MVSSEWPDIVIKIGSKRDQLYPVDVLESPAGKTKLSVLVKIPSDTDVIQQGLDKLRQLKQVDNALLVKFGTHLYTSLFQDDVKGRYAESRGLAKAQGGLRLRLVIEPPELAMLPWELLCDPNLQEFLELSKEVHIVRQMPVPRPIEELAIEPPLRILVAIAVPEDKERLKTDHEKSTILNALAPLGEMIKVEFLEPATISALEHKIKEGFHVLHYIGHGTVEQEVGKLVLEDNDGYSDPLAGNILATFLKKTSIRLAVLNTCEGSRGAPENIDVETQTAFSGVAQELVAAGLPAVIAMQFKIVDSSAQLFVGKFYSLLAEFQPIDQCVTSARGVLLRKWQWEYADWATPILFLQSDSGMLFQNRYTNLSDKVPVRAGETTLRAGSAERKPLNTWPLFRDKGFIDRVAELERLTNALRDRKAVGIFGMGGIGKTALAKEVIFRLSKDFSENGIVYLPDEHNRPDELIQTIIFTYESIPLPDWSGMSDLEKLMRAKQLVMSNRPLICVNNVRDERFFRQVLEISTECALLITSQYYLAGMRDLLDEVIDLDGLEPEEAVQLLEGRLRQPLNKIQRATALKVGELVGFLPMAITIIAARMRERHLTLEQILSRLQEAKGLLTELQIGSESVQARFELMYYYLSAEEKRLFAIFGFFVGVEALDERLVMRIASLLEVEKTLENLSARSLLRIRNQQIAIHPLLHLFAREKLQDYRNTALPRYVILALLIYPKQFADDNSQKPSREIRLAIEWCIQEDLIDLIDLIIEYWQTQMREIRKQKIAQYLNQSGETRTVFTLEVFELLFDVATAADGDTAKRTIRNQKHLQLALQNEFLPALLQIWNLCNRLAAPIFDPEPLCRLILNEVGRALTEQPAQDIGIGGTCTALLLADSPKALEEAIAHHEAMIDTWIVREVARKRDSPGPRSTGTISGSLSIFDEEDPMQGLNRSVLAGVETGFSVFDELERTATSFEKRGLPDWAGKTRQRANLIRQHASRPTKKPLSQALDAQSFLLHLSWANTEIEARAIAAESPRLVDDAIKSFKKLVDEKQDGDQMAVERLRRLIKWLSQWQHDLFGRHWI